MKLENEYNFSIQIIPKKFIEKRIKNIFSTLSNEVLFEINILISKKCKNRNAIRLWKHDIYILTS